MKLLERGAPQSNQKFESWRDEPMKRATGIEIPKFLSHLKTYGGYPVPFVQMYFDGKPDFRVIDPERSDECLRDKLCAICGKRLGEFCYFIGGALCKENHLFADAPMHEDCADFASKTCPFVSGKKHEYSTRPVDETVTTVLEMASPVRPEKMFIFKTRTKTVQRVEVNGSPFIQAGPWSRVTEIQKVLK